jgi:hypothetical protein
LSEPEGPVTPVLAASSEKAVFQYLGNLDRPRQIAFRTSTARRIYDFRTRRYQEDDGEWARPEALQGASSERFLELVRFWERMVRASGNLTRSSDPE